MPLADLRRSVDLGRSCSRAETAWVRAEAHRSTHVGDVLLRLHERDDGIAALRCKLAGMTVVEADHVARELDYRALHSKTDPEEWKTRFACITNRLEHTFDSSNAETAGNEDRVEVCEKLACLLPPGEHVAGKPRDLHTDIIRDASM